MTEAEDLLFVNDFVLIEQHCTEVTVAFEDIAVADFLEDQIDRGYRPEQFGRIWIHTHPGDSPQPSSVDVETFERVFGNCDWAVMFIIAQGGKTYAELYWRHGGPAALRMNVEIDYSQPFASSDQETWNAEYRSYVHNQHQLIPYDFDEWEEWLSDNIDARELPTDSTLQFGPPEPPYKSFMNSDLSENA
jgi:proteasome lid subunit RPN8/RPN11